MEKQSSSKNSPSISVDFKRFTEINTALWYQIAKLRSDVFVVEQICVYPDFDDYDQDGTHLLLTHDDKVIGYARILGRELCKIGRICIETDYRGKGLGNLLMKECMEWLKNQNDVQHISMSAQTYLTDFYSTYGFSPEGNMYLEDGIPHLKMVYQTSFTTDVNKK